VESSSLSDGFTVLAGIILPISWPQHGAAQQLFEWHAVGSADDIFPLDQRPEKH
jgi:hypothetical protein